MMAEDLRVAAMRQKRGALYHRQSSLPQFSRSQSSEDERGGNRAMRPGERMRKSQSSEEDRENMAMRLCDRFRSQNSEEDREIMALRLGGRLMHRQCSEDCDRELMASLRLCDRLRKSQSHSEDEERGSRGRELLERMRPSVLSRSSSGSPVEMLCSSPPRGAGRRGTGGGYRPGSVEELLLSSSPPAARRLLRGVRSSVARDPTQPASGTLSGSLSGTASPQHAAAAAASMEEGLEGEHEEDEEGRDTFSLPRPRSSTCPESRAWKRKLKVRAERRPASPPACGVEVSLLSQSLSAMLIKHELSIPHRHLPLLTETNKDDREEREEGEEEGEAKEEIEEQGEEWEIREEMDEREENEEPD